MDQNVLADMWGISYNPGQRNVMVRKPIVIILITLCYLCSPFLVILQGSIITNTPVIGPYNIFQKLSPVDWGVLLLYFLCAIAVFSVKKWGWYTFIGASLTLIVNNIVVYSLRPRYAFLALIAYNLIITVVAAVFFRRTIIAPYFNPRIRWWEQDHRLTISIFMEIQHKKATIHAGLIDISENGAFIACDTMLSKGSLYPVNLHCMRHRVNLSARVIRKATAPITSGYGLKFEEIGNIEKTALQRMISDLQHAKLLNKQREKSIIKAQKRICPPRYQIHTGVSITFDDKNVHTLLVDISQSGCLLKLKDQEEYTLNIPLQITLRCLNQELTLHSSVKWQSMGEKNTLLGVAFEYKSKQERKEIKKIIARVKKTRAPRRLASARPLSKETLTEYALQSPYRIIHRILQIVSLRNRKMRF